jgi:hypothetical protein
MYLLRRDAFQHRAMLLHNLVHYVVHGPVLFVRNSSDINGRHPFVSISPLRSTVSGAVLDVGSSG